MEPAVLGARALVLASVTCFLGIAGHVGADGLLPGAPTLALLVAGVSVASLALLARPASTRRVVSLLVLGQTAVHLVLSTTAGHAGDAPTVARLRPTPAALPTEGGRRVGSLSDQYAATLGGRYTGRISLRGRAADILGTMVYQRPFASAASIACSRLIAGVHTYMIPPAGASRPRRGEQGASANAEEDEPLIRGQ